MKKLFKDLWSFIKCAIAAYVITMCGISFIEFIPVNFNVMYWDENYRIVAYVIFTYLYLGGVHRGKS